MKYLSIYLSINNSNQFEAVISYVGDGKVYRLPSEKENTAEGRGQLSFFCCFYLTNHYSDKK